MEMAVLALNAGSSSVKAALFEGGRAVWHTKADLHDHAFEEVLREMGERHVDAVGHRIVHGGGRFFESTRITPEVKAELGRVAALAPEHNRLELAGIDATERLLGREVPQVAVFDTTFHRSLPPQAFIYPGPYGWVDQGIRRYGFHGISHQYVSRHAAELLGRDLKSLRLITCHLGNGCSLAAVRDGHSIDTTMGFTPLDGLMMGTRSGSVDPGILIYLGRHGGCGPDDLDRILNRESGLKGISGISGDMREILATKQRGHQRAGLAFDIFVHRLCREVAAMLPELGGLDALVFTAGIGENCPEVRAAAGDLLRHLGVQLDAEKNAAVDEQDHDISASGSAIRTLVIHTREEQEIAREVEKVIAAK